MRVRFPFPWSQSVSARSVELRSRVRGARRFTAPDPVGRRRTGLVYALESSLETLQRQQPYP